jgi:1-acyl-sn-glycerol-3-phosphate acyltransferase
VARALLAVPLIVLYTLGFGALALVVGPFDRGGRLSRRLAGAWSRAILWTLGVRVAVSGRENVVAGPAVYAANHGSALDIPILFGHLPVDFRVIHKRSLYAIPVIGLCLYLGGHIGIDRGKAFRARKSLERAAGRIRAGTSVAVFPEGTRSPGPEVRAFKRGCFALARDAGVSVVPVSLCGVKDVVPRGLPTLRPGTVRLVIHPAVRSGADPERLAEHVRDVVRGECQGA